MPALLHVPWLKSIVMQAGFLKFWPEFFTKPLIFLHPILARPEYFEFLKGRAMPGGFNSLFVEFEKYSRHGGLLLFHSLSPQAPAKRSGFWIASALGPRNDDG
jgi:hypothetical protein